MKTKWSTYSPVYFQLICASKISNTNHTYYKPIIIYTSFFNDSENLSNQRNNSNNYEHSKQEQVVMLEHKNPNHFGQTELNFTKILF